jgi:pyruvate dehydrogenase E1 component alpha subunit
MWVLRLVDMALEELRIQGLIERPVPTGFGQEAVGIGATATLRQGDISTIAHRPHAQCVGRGAFLGPAIAELMDGGYDRRDRVKRSPLLGIGRAYSQWLAADDGVTLCVAEDRDVDPEHFGKAANMAVMWRLPIVLVVENIRYLPARRDDESGVPASALSRTAAGRGMSAVSVDGHDVEAVRDCVAEAVRRVRAGDGPALVEAVTSGTTDPLLVARRRLVAAGVPVECLVEVEPMARSMVADAVAFAKAQPRTYQ